MDFEYEIQKEVKGLKPKTIEDFSRALEDSINKFEENNLFIESAWNKTLEMKHYHSLLRTLFHQTWTGPGTFALAGSLIDEQYAEARSYLLHHADEEKLHWTWIISDLRSTGFMGPDPREEFPEFVTQAYVAYATYLALRFPIGRLAMAATLEGVSSRFGSKYGMEFARSKNLQPDQVRFFIAHSLLDEGHSNDISSVISGLNLDGVEISRLCHVVECTEALYKAMYNEAYKKVR